MHVLMLCAVPPVFLTNCGYAETDVACSATVPDDSCERP